MSIQFASAAAVNCNHFDYTDNKSHIFIFNLVKPGLELHCNQFTRYLLGIMRKKIHLTHKQTRSRLELNFKRLSKLFLASRNSWDYLLAN